MPTRLSSVMRRSASAWGTTLPSSVRRRCIRGGHEDGLPELPEHEALEQLAAFGVLARCVDIANVAR
ncbi:hypothetical protein OG259_09565 [Streptomyces sp. NBC_00250]|uniref:hypothetical protein n=1 Tax=Streptomyces sp. NBC_00250 TaxID=2903641 RepID=UPI002E2BDF8C|nr:hypothetical protein [Streptomyces sp. NBC_00250]